VPQARDLVSSSLEAANRASSFTARAFKRATGSAPGQYRKLAQTTG